MCISFSSLVPLAYVLSCPSQAKLLPVEVQWGSPSALVCPYMCVSDVACVRLFRVNFVLVHVFTAGYWLPFLLNNPLDFPWVFSTLDAPASAILPAGKCTPIIYDNVVLDIGLWLIWSVLRVTT